MTSNVNKHKTTTVYCTKMIFNGFYLTNHTVANHVLVTGGYIFNVHWVIFIFFLAIHNPIRTDLQPTFGL